MDVDCNVYNTVKIGNQWWMAENLKVTHYRNGDAIPNVIDDSTWTNLSTGAYCVYDNNESYAATYGNLYNWYAVDDSRNIAPVGWHVPTNVEWQRLADNLGGIFVAGDKLKDSRAEYWDNPDWAGTNESGFSVLPGGCRVFSSGSYSSMGRGAEFWTSEEFWSDWAWFWWLQTNPNIHQYQTRKIGGLSVRCIKNDATWSFEY
jgi:uncharacterized protein (TIGR02145 family)